MQDLLLHTEEVLGYTEKYNKMYYYYYYYYYYHHHHNHYS
jgi:hypothetical protein